MTSAAKNVEDAITTIERDLNTGLQNLRGVLAEIRHELLASRNVSTEVARLPVRTTAGELSLMLSVLDVAIHLRCSTRTVQRRIKAGELESLRDGRRVLVPRWSLEAYIDSLSR